MGTSLHTALGLGEVHQVHQWEYANESLRLAATGFVASDQYKWALQTDTNTYWVLTSHSPTAWIQVNPTDPENVFLLKIPAKKSTPGTLEKGTPVALASYDTGANTVLVEAAKADVSGINLAVGILEEQVTDTVAGHAVYIGPTPSVDTTSYSVGDILYLADGGGLAYTPPTGENSVIQPVCLVLTVGDPGVVAAIAQGTEGLPNLADGKLWVGDVSNGVPTSRDWAHDHSTDAEGGTIPIVNITTTETDTGKHAVPDGANGITFIPDGLAGVRFQAEKASAGTISKGEVVYIVGYDVGGGIVTVERAKADSTSTLPALGVVVKEITDLIPGEVVTTGNAINLDTSTWSVGDSLWVSPTTAGGMVSTKPTGASTFVQKVAQVTHVDTNDGTLVVFGAGRTNEVPNLADGELWVGDPAEGPPMSRPWVHEHSTDAEAGVLPPEAISIPQSNVYYVGKHGSDSNSGKSHEAAFLTIGAAISAVNTQTPAQGNGFKITIVDAGGYTENFTVPVYTGIYGSNATITGNVVLSDNSAFVVNGIISIVGDCVTKSSGTGNARIQCGFIAASLDGNGIVCTSGDITGTAFNMTAQNGNAIGGTTSGRITCFVTDIQVTGTGTAISNESNGIITGTFSYIYAPSGTAVFCGPNAEIDMYVDHVDADTSLNVATGGSLNVTVSHLLGTQIGTPNVSRAGVSTVHDHSDNDEGGVLPGTSISVAQLNKYYVGKHGNDSNNGQSHETAFLTIAVAISAAEAQSPSQNNGYEVEIVDAGVYAENIEVTSYISIVGPGATLVGNLEVHDFVSVTLNGVQTFVGDCVLKQYGTGNAQLSIGFISTSPTGNGIVCSLGDMTAEVLLCQVQDGAAIGGATSGRVTCSIATVKVTGTGTAVDNASTGHVIGDILYIEAASGTAVSCGPNGEVDLFVRHLEADVAYDVTAGGDVSLVVGHIVGSAVGNARVTEAGKQLLLDGSKPMEGDLVLGSNEITDVKAFKFDVDDVNTYGQGTLHWNKADGTLEVDTDITGVHLQVGQEEFVRVYNGTGGTIENGSVVRISGAASDRPTVAKAIASDADAVKTVGVATNEILNGEVGFVTVRGLVRDLDTSTFAGGSALYLSTSTVGGFQSAVPAPPNIAVNVGIVVSSHSSDGIVFVNPRVETTLFDDILTSETDQDKLAIPDGLGGLEFIPKGDVLPAGPVFSAKKSTAGTINKGQPVYPVGYDNGIITVELAQADSSLTMPALGIAADTITAATQGEVVVLGEVKGINTSTWSVGDSLWVDDVNPGTLTGGRPDGTALVQKIAQVTSAHVTTGSIVVVGAGRTNDVPNIEQNHMWIGDGSGVAQPTEIVDLPTVTLDSADVVMFSDTSDSNNLKKASVSDLESHISDNIISVYGTGFQHESDLTESQTTSTAYSTKLTLTTPSILAGTYRIGIQYAWWGSSTSQSFIGRVYVDDTDEVWYHEEEPQDTDSGQRHRAAGFVYHTFTSGIHNIRIQWASSLNATAAILDARLELWRIE